MIHLLIGRLQFLDVVPRSGWLSFAGGVAVAYVFLHILPNSAGISRPLPKASGSAGTPPRPGFTSSRWPVWPRSMGSSAQPRPRGGAHPSGTRAKRSRPRIFWLHIGSFGLYNVLIGYLLLHREETGLWPLVIYFVAMALHFVTNDFGLRQDQQGAV